MKKVLSIIITLVSIGLIVYGVTYFFKDNNKRYDTSKESFVEEKKDNEESEIHVSETLIEPEYDLNKEKVILYLFWGDGCPHCQEAEEWLSEISPTYGKYFDVVDYEVWYHDDNLQLMKDVGNYLGKDVKGVPFIVIGDTSYDGFANVYKDRILNTIFEEYEKIDRVDIVKIVENNM